jgi:hypothetical protein
VVPAGSPRAEIVEDGTTLSPVPNPQTLHDNGQLLRTPAMVAEGIVALVVLPIRVNGRSRACLNLASKHVRRLPDSTIDVLQALAIQFGLAMERLSAREDALMQRQNLEGFFSTLTDFVFVLNTTGHIRLRQPRRTHGARPRPGIAGPACVVGAPAACTRICTRGAGCHVAQRTRIVPAAFAQDRWHRGDGGHPRGARQLERATRAAGHFARHHRAACPAGRTGNATSFSVPCSTTFRSWCG